MGGIAVGVAAKPSSKPADPTREKERKGSLREAPTPSWSETRELAAGPFGFSGLKALSIKKRVLAKANPPTIKVV